jgi:NAD(P)-dependent dehydrogenase (short-subunit alcohol dehydrogenase family)
LWFIDNHFASTITLEDVAAVAGVSPCYLTRAFCDATGLSLMRYVRGRRLSEAARSLAGGAKDILSVALDAGYGSHEAFTRAFHAEQHLRTGNPPYYGDLTQQRKLQVALAGNVLVNNAGLGDAALFDRSDWARTRQILRTNIFAVTQLALAVVSGMVERGRGGVLNIGSGAGLTVMPNAAAYVASKHFVAGFSEALRADLAGTGVTVTQVCPGPVDSEFDQAAGSVVHGRCSAAVFPNQCRTVCTRSAGRI